MDAVLFRTAMSPGIREQHDEFPLIANRDGKMVVGQFGAFIHTFLQMYEGEIYEGDLFLTNDPYSCDGAISHTPDWARAHADLQARPRDRVGRHVRPHDRFRRPHAGSMPTDAQQIFEEGIIIPAQALRPGRASERYSRTHPAQLPDTGVEQERPPFSDCRVSVSPRAA